MKIAPKNIVIKQKKIQLSKLNYMSSNKHLETEGVGGTLNKKQKTRTEVNFLIYKKRRSEIRVN